MTISELISKLEAIQTTHGPDLEVGSTSPSYDEGYAYPCFAAMLDDEAATPYVNICFETEGEPLNEDSDEEDDEEGEEWKGCGDDGDDD